MDAFVSARKVDIHILHFIPLAGGSSFQNPCSESSLFDSSSCNAHTGTRTAKSPLRS